MICPACTRVLPEHAATCVCSYRFNQIALKELAAWCKEFQRLTEAAYLAAPPPTPWQQSSKSGTFKEWTRLRIPVILLLISFQVTWR